MDFTREPILESIITPKEGCKLAVRNSKGIGQEEFFVDSLEVVSFSGTFFFRSMERPKAFLLPATDYEVIEVREARMVLKTAGHDRSKSERGARSSKKQARDQAEETIPEEILSEATPAAVETKSEGGRKRERRGRHQKRQRAREETPQEKPVLPEGVEPSMSPEEAPLEVGAANGATPKRASTIIPPPSSLISETLGRYREDQLFKDVFFVQEQVEQAEHPMPAPTEENHLREEQPSSSEEEADPFNR